MTFLRIQRALARHLQKKPAAATLPPDVDPATLAPDTIIPFRCNLCGTHNAAPLAQLQRELPSCKGCGSTVRNRAMAHLLVTELLGAPGVLGDLPQHRDKIGIGLSDDETCARPLARAFGYTNTYFHAEPRLDIANLAAERDGSCDFLLASDVYEHVVPPVSRAFINAKRLLKPGGVFVFSVPFSLAADTVEHFPELHDFRIAEEAGRWRLFNRTRDGREQVFDELVFHGGPGSTLEMRLFSRAAVEHEFAAAGFSSFRVAAEPYLPFGIVWPEPWSVPFVARA